MSKKDTGQFWETASCYLDHHLKDIRQVSRHTINSYRDSLNNFVEMSSRPRKSLIYEIVMPR